MKVKVVTKVDGQEARTGAGSALEDIVRDRMSKKQKLRGMPVLIAGDSAASRDLRDDLNEHYLRSHQLSRRVRCLDVRTIYYGNGQLNFEIIDPEGVLSPEEIKELVQHGDNHYIARIEDPALRDPMKYHLDTLVEVFGKRYTELCSIETLDDDKRKIQFMSFVGANLGKILGEVIHQSQLEVELWDICEEIYERFRSFEKPLRFCFGNGDDVEDYDTSRCKTDINIFRDTFMGYLSTIIQPKIQAVAEAELENISYRIGREWLSEELPGQLSWTIPFLDGRSDHNKTNPNEGVRAKQLADFAKWCNVSAVYTFRAHSYRQMEFFERQGIHFENITLTNEFISDLVQDEDLIFEQFYILSPDEGGVPDAMVFARELHRRTHGDFPGRVVAFKKKRLTHGKIAYIEFLCSYIYDPTKEDPSTPRRDKKTNRLPYDHKTVYAGVYKNPDDPHYIGNLFRLEAHADPESLPPEMRGGVMTKEELKKLIYGHRAGTRDDILGTGGTMLGSGRAAHKDFGSDVIAMIEAASMVGNAIDKLENAYDEGYFTLFISASGIVHPGHRAWHIMRKSSHRLYNAHRDRHMAWLDKEVPNFAERLEKYDTRKQDDAAQEAADA